MQSLPHLALFIQLLQLTHQNALRPTASSSANTYTLRSCTHDDVVRFHAQSTALELYIEHCNIPELENAIFIRYAALETLEISDSNLSALQDYALNGLKQLRSLSLTRNNLTHLKSWSNEPLTALLSLDLRRNAISALTLNSFHRYPNLQRLNLAVNLIDDIDDGIFRWMPNLKYLNLGRNQLKAIDARNFYGMHRLTHLSLHHNYIDDIEWTSFETNTHMRSLRLEGNALHDLRFLSVNMVQLVHLNLSHNAIETLDQQTFSKDYDIRDLDLSYNEIKELRADTFSGLESLESLNISHNAIQHVEPDVFREQRNLQRIDLSLNKLTTLPAELFNFTSYLEYVNLSMNALQKIEPQTFAGQTTLRILDVSRNRLQADGFLQNFPINLERSQLKLNLSHNHFTMLNITTLAHFASVELAGNTWNCKWVIAELQRSGSELYKLHFGRNATLPISIRRSDDLSNILRIDCFDEDTMRSVILLERPTTTANESLEANFDCSLPPLTWPKISLEKFDSRSMIIWLLILIVVVFAIQRIVGFVKRKRYSKKLAEDVDADEMKHLKTSLSFKYRDSLDEIVVQKTCRHERKSSLRQ